MYKKYFEYLFRQVKNIPGDIVECGIGAGGTFSILLGLCGEEKDKRKVWAFDSFEGFPPRTDEDRPSKLSDEIVKSRFKKRGYLNEKELVQRIMKNNYYPIDNVKIIKGFYQDTLPHKYIGKGIALLHLDCDLYQSYKSGLSLYDKVVPGGIIALDEYAGKLVDAKWPGARKAIDEFLHDNNIIHKLRCYICIDKDETFEKHFIVK